MQKENNWECFNYQKDHIVQAVIIGSFRKHLIEIQSIRKSLITLGVTVLSPVDSPPINEGEEFIIFESDNTSDPKLLQDAVFEKIRISSFVIVANIDGYLGDATLMEIGYTLAAGIDLFSIEPITSLHVKPYCKLLQEQPFTLPFLKHSKKFSLMA